MNEQNFFADTDFRPRTHVVPVYPFDSEVFARGSDVDRMAFCPQLLDTFERIDADSSVCTAVMFLIVLRVTNKP